MCKNLEGNQRYASCWVCAWPRKVCSLHGQRHIQAHIATFLMRFANFVRDVCDIFDGNDMLHVKAWKLVFHADLDCSLLLAVKLRDLFWNQVVKQMAIRGYDTFRNIIRLFAVVKVPNCKNRCTCFLVCPVCAHVCAWQKWLESIESMSV